MLDPGSFRDKSGFVIIEKNNVLRIINKSYADNYEKFIKSGLYNLLLDHQKINSHKEFKTKKVYSDDQYAVLETEKIPFISYPFEWSFNQFKEAALFTLEIQKQCLEYGMLLKDASPYNVQFLNNKPIFIDILSFEKVKNKNYTWKAYNQFSEMFLSPLILMSCIDLKFNCLLKEYINGIPNDLLIKLLPIRKKMNPFIFTNYLIKSKAVAFEKKINIPISVISKKQQISIISYLESFIKKIKVNSEQSEWENYYLNSHDEKYHIYKEKIFKGFINKIDYTVCLDIGCNDGKYSRILAESAKRVYSIDFDSKCINRNYKINKELKIKNITSLIVDIVNPSSSIGWLNRERKSFFDRLEQSNLIVALALMHHIINLNIPLKFLLEVFRKTDKYVIVEYVPFSDPMSQIIFSTRGDDFEYISQNDFETEIQKDFNILEQENISSSKRVLYLLEKK